jgi:hypothetical protein
MSYRVRPFRNGRDGFEVDIHTEATDGRDIRERVRSPVSTKEASKRWKKKSPSPEEVTGRKTWRGVRDSNPWPPA